MNRGKTDFCSAPLWEVFTSIDGEVNNIGQGVLSKFIRVAGCNLHCSWCDTKITQTVPKEASWENSASMMRSGIIGRDHVQKYTITGGEPLLYPEWVREVVNTLVALGKSVSVETNGSRVLVPGLDCCWVIDDKPPSSGHLGSFVYSNLCTMREGRDWIKIVIATQEDLEWAIEETKYISSRIGKANIAWSLSETCEVEAKHIISVLLEESLHYVRINAQLHKYLGLL